MEKRYLAAVLSRLGYTTNVTRKKHLYKTSEVGYSSGMNSHFSNLIEQLQLESGQRKHRQSILTHVKCIRKQEDRIDELSLVFQAVVFVVPINP